MNYQKDTFQPNSIVVVNGHLITPTVLLVVIFVCVHMCVRKKRRPRTLNLYGLSVADAG
jgi:hypothetical protein